MDRHTRDRVPSRADSPRARVPRVRGAHGEGNMDDMKNTITGPELVDFAVGLRRAILDGKKDVTAAALLDEAARRYSVHDELVKAVALALEKGKFKVWDERVLKAALKAAGAK